MELAEKVLLILMCSATLLCARGYTNYTVGGDLGWYDVLENPKVDYQKWAEGKNFSLGDYLSFNTDRNHSVIQTYNVTTFKNCDYYDAEDDDTIQWSASNPTVDKTPVSVAIPLVKEGMNYFFSSDYDGEQCKNGQRFMINVTHGEGLPPSLRPEAPAPSSASTDDGSNNVPDGQFNFNNPHDIDSDKNMPTTTKSESSSTWTRVGGGNLTILFILLCFMKEVLH